MRFLTFYEAIKAEMMLAIRQGPARPLKNAPFRSLRLSASRLGGTRNIQYIPVVNPAEASRYKRD